MTTDRGIAKRLMEIGHTRTELYTFYELKCIALENQVPKDGLTKQELFDRLDGQGLLPY